MCFECADVVHNLGDLATVEAFDLPDLDDGAVRFSPDGVRRVAPEAPRGPSRGVGHDHPHPGPSGSGHGPADGHVHPRRGGGSGHEHGRHGGGSGLPLHDGGHHVPESTAPAPRYPDVQIGGFYDLLSAARDVVEKREVIYTTVDGEEVRAGTRPGAGYDIEDGEYDRALLVVSSNYDRRCYEAVAEALREKGAAVDVVTLDRISGRIDPWRDELPGVHTGVVENHPLLRMAGVRWWEDLAEADDEYDLLIYGVGGPNRPLSGTAYGRIPWRTEEDLASPANRFPTGLWELINEKTTAVVKRAEQVRLTDPEGTDLTFTNYDEDGVYFNRNIPGHILGHPSYLTPDADTSGVVAGTLNHAGAFPRIEVEVRDARVVGVRGGGEYGELWREMLEVTEGIQYPGLPSTGLFWLWELAIGTNPKVSRPPIEDIHRVQFPEMERRRSGIIHCGFGIQYVIEPYAAKLEGVPWGHVHVHLNFPTYTGRTADGEEITLIDEGRLTVLDHPEVREKAAEYGDPDELLTEDWIPAVPGINASGDYAEDYAADPVDWIEREMAEQARA